MFLYLFLSLFHLNIFLSLSPPFFLLLKSFSLCHSLTHILIILSLSLLHLHSVPLSIFLLLILFHLIFFPLSLSLSVTCVLLSDSISLIICISSLSYTHYHLSLFKMYSTTTTQSCQLIKTQEGQIFTNYVEYLDWAILNDAFSCKRGLNNW